MPRAALPHPAALRRWILPLAALAAAMLVACSPAPAPEPAPTSQGVVDSILPIEEEVRRFLETVDSVPVTLRHGASSIETLVRRFLRAVETLDTLAFARLVLQRDEFIGLYYPHTDFTGPPYSLSPALLWFQMQNRSSRGMTRLLQRDGGHAIKVRSVSCPPAARHEGPNLLWEGCLVEVTDSAGAARGRRLFGTIIERDRTFKFLTLANEY
jgi:hypothetical protein